MSTRTIIEINHDYIRELRDPANFASLLSMLSSAALANESTWNRDIGLPGIRVLGQRHHSETLTLKVD